MTIYDKNMSLLEQSSPELYKVLTEEKPIFNIKLEKVNDGSNYIMENEEARCFLHSVYNIDDEMEITFRHIQKDSETLILFGLGCGYVLEYLEKNYKEINKLVIVEPSLEMFKHFLENIDLARFTNSFRQVTFIVNQNKETTCTILDETIMKNLDISFAYNISYITIYKEYYNSIKEYLVEGIKRLTNRLRVASVSKNAWLCNSVRNFNCLSSPIENILHLFKGKPTIIVSAGPSLNKNMHLIKKAKNKCIVLAVGSAVKILDANGIEPHFRVALDGFPREKKFLEGIDTNIPLIFSNKLYYEILPEYKGDKFRIVTETDYLVKYIYEKLNMPYQEVETGSSVANFTLSMLCKAGCSDVIFMGQDLCYTNGELRAKGANNLEEEKLSPESKNYIKFKDISGNDVYTLDMYLTMKYGFEELVRKYSNVKFINATEGGLKIKGVENKSLNHVLKDDVLEELNIDFKDYIQNIGDKCRGINYSDKLKIELLTLEEETNEIIKINNERLTILKKIKKDRNKGIKVSRILNNLKYLDNFESRFKLIPFYNFVVEKMMIEVLYGLKLRNNYEGKDENRQVEMYYNIFWGMTAEMDAFTKLINGVLKEFAELQSTC